MCSSWSGHHDRLLSFCVVAVCTCLSPLGQLLTHCLGCAPHMGCALPIQQGRWCVGAWSGQSFASRHGTSSDMRVSVWSFLTMFQPVSGACRFGRGPDATCTALGRGWLNLSVARSGCDRGCSATRDMSLGLLRRQVLWHSAGQCTNVLGSVAECLLVPCSLS
jgi:hypothetical protein